MIKLERMIIVSDSLEMLSDKAHMSSGRIRDEGSEQDGVSLFGSERYRAELHIPDLPSATTSSQFNTIGTSLTEEYDFELFDNISDESHRRKDPKNQPFMISEVSEKPLEMQYSAQHVPLLFHGSSSLAAPLRPLSPTSDYDHDVDPEQYQDFACANPYDDPTDVDSEMGAVPYNAPTPCSQRMEDHSKLSVFSELRSVIRSDGPDVIDTSFPPRDENLRALVPEGLTWSIKTGNEYQPHLTVPEYSVRPLSHSVSVLEVKSSVLMTDGVVKSPDQSPIQSPSLSTRRSSSRSPTLSLNTIEEDISTASNADLKQKLKVHGGSVHKKLFGDNGWLEDHKPPPPPQPPRRRSSVMRELGRKLKVLKADSPSNLSPTSGGSGSPSSPNFSVPVSLTSAQQSKLYAELEFMICTTANDFILNQYYDGRVSPESIEKVHEFWASKNRPQVIEFRFDQITQRNLIVANRRTLKFAGESSTNPIMLESNLTNWRIIAQEMNVRTFCLPDSAIRKHLHDARNILDMLNASLATLQQFRDISVQAQDEMMDEYSKRRPRNVSGTAFSWMGTNQREGSKRIGTADMIII